MGSVAGWDIGGAHVKAARVDGRGRIEDVVQVACPLWRGADVLTPVMARLARRLGPVSRHVVTMTGEVADVFADRRAGVHHIVETALSVLSSGGHDLLVYGGDRTFLDGAAARSRPEAVASMNWQAPAVMVGARVRECLLVDIGSTTTDIIPVRGGRPCWYGHSDHERLCTGTLVYSGVVRTPVMALAHHVVVAGRDVPVMAEVFATTSDIYRVLRWLPAGSDLMPTSDGGKKNVGGSARRLARMVGLDVGDRPMACWRDLARSLAERHVEVLVAACRRVSARAGLSEGAPVIGSGCGRFLVARLGACLGRPYSGIETLFDEGDDGGDPRLLSRAATCAPAVSVARLGLSCADNA